MDLMEIARLVFRWLHILPAVILLGGAFFLRLALWPALASIQEDESLRVQEAFRRGWAKWVGISAGLLLLSGIVNTVLIVREYEVEPVYHGLLLVKVLLALGIIYIASMLVGRSEAADRFRQKTRFWLNVNVILALALIGVAGYMRLADRTPKVAEEPRPDSVATSRDILP